MPRKEENTGLAVYFSLYFSIEAQKYKKPATFGFLSEKSLPLPRK
jgi:hypothetical protein